MTLLPTYEQCLDLPNDHERVIPQEFEDDNKHMNIRFYLDLTAEGVDTVVRDCGLDKDYRDGRGLGFFTAEHHLSYYSETVVGDRVSVHVLFVERSDRTMHGMAFLTNHRSRRLASTLEFTLIHVDLATRRPTDMAGDLIAGLDREMARRIVSWPAPVCGSMGVRRS